MFGKKYKLQFSRPNPKKCDFPQNHHAQRVQEPNRDFCLTWVGGRGGRGRWQADGGADRGPLLCRENTLRSEGEMYGGFPGVRGHKLCRMSTCVCLYVCECVCARCAIVRGDRKRVEL